MPPLEAELRRRNGTGTLQPWTLIDDASSPTGLADPVADAQARTRLQTIADRLNQALSVTGSTVALDAVTLAALESITATITGSVTITQTQLDPLAKDTTVAATNAKVDATNTKLDTLNAKDFATQTTLAQLAGKDFATQATVASILAQLDDATADTVLSVLKALNAKDYATEATLAALKTTADAIQANTDTLEALITTIRDEQHRRTDPIATGTNIIGYFSSTVSKKVGEAKFYVAGKRVAVGLNERALFRLSNPAGSGKTVYLVKFTMYSNQAARVRYNEDGTLPGAPTAGTARNVVLHAADAAVSSLQAVNHADLPTGGTTYDNESRITGDAPLILDFPPLVMAPGKSLAVFTESLAASGDFTANAYIYEE